MQVACHGLTGPSLGPVLDGQGTMVLAACCYELLGGLQPRSRGCSLHICTVLQHLLLANEREVLGLMLQYHAPFVLLRALDRPGCAELLQSLLGCEAILPKVAPAVTSRQLQGHSLQQVRQYLLACSWPSFVAAVLDQGARMGAAAAGPASSSSSCSASPSRRQGPSSPGPRTPVRKASFQSPSTPGISTPGLTVGTPQLAATTTPCSTPQRFPLPAPGAWSMEASPFKSLEAPPSSPSTQVESGPSFLDLPVRPVKRSPRRRPSLELPEAAQDDSVSVSCGATSSTASCPGGGDVASLPPLPLPALREASEPRCADAESTERHRGVDVLLEFLSGLLEAFGRSAEAAHKARVQQREEEDTEVKLEVQTSLLMDVFVETSLIPNLFQLLRQGSVQFDAASLLYALLQYVLNPRRRPPDLVEPLLAHFLPHAESLGVHLLRGTPKSIRHRRSFGLDRTSTSHKRTSDRGGEGELRFSGYTVREPLGALRVAVVQILAALSELAPERALVHVKAAVWSVLVKWFFANRCNHIFQASCGRLWINVINHGSPQLQHLVFVKMRLLVGLCDAVLAEGACGDRWHESRLVPRSGRENGAGGDGTSGRVEKNQVMTCKTRHPGGLGGIVPVILALEERARSPPQDLTPVAQSPARPPLAELSGVPQVPQSFDVEQKSQAVAAPVPCFAAKLLAATSVWPQVLKAVERPGPRPPVFEPAPRQREAVVVAEADAS
eukprot:TRINITY_DN30315_c0_g1_i1.p1 TRINITY_DN30315_c0_g1~~TRINITY_DN30315_c0_g1_i1.p1  ORF type:complete len:844 (+),score=148.90 TRINITY_DN30315_c0_g1_i1:355-2532(+)